jgi:hypothetical protein
MTATRISLGELRSRLYVIEVLISVASQRADDLCTYREHLECARIALALLLRDLEFGSVPA